MAQGLVITETNTCLADNPDEEVSVKITLDHEAGDFDEHRGFILSTSAGTFTAESASNTIGGAGGVGTAAISIGYDIGEAGNQRNMRWVKLTAPAADWLAGITISYLAFGAANNDYDTIHSQTLEICDLPEICNECT